MNSKISLDTQEQLMNQAKAASKAKYDNALLAEQEEKIKNLLLLNNLQDPSNFRTEMKPRKENTPFEDNLPKGLDYKAILNNPEIRNALAERYRNTSKPDSKFIKDLPRKYENLPWRNDENTKDEELPSIALESKEPLTDEDKKRLSEDAAREMAGYRVNPQIKYPEPSLEETDVDEELAKASSFNAIDSMKRASARDVHGKPINPSGVVAYQAKAEPEFHGGENPRKDQTIDKYKTNIFSKPEVPESPENEWKNMAWPEVNTALKAIADRDPELMQLPEIQALLKRGKAGYDKQLALTTVAPFTSNPELWMNQAKAWREQGDKNLMDAANNLELLRNRQLEAAKSAASDLTAQKSNAVNMHGQVLNFENSLVQSATMLNQEAAALSLEAEKVHENGDVAMDKALTNARSFFERVGVDMGLSKEEAAIFNNMANKLTNTNLRQALDYIRKYESKIFAPMRPVFNEALRNIEAGIAEYDRAMNESAKLKSQADYKNKIADDRLYTASTLGGKYKIPEWMDADTLRQFNEVVNNGRGSNLTDTQGGNTSGDVNNVNADKDIIANPEGIEAKENKGNGKPGGIKLIKATWDSIVDNNNLTEDQKLNYYKDIANAMLSNYTEKGVKATSIKLHNQERVEGSAADTRKDYSLQLSEKEIQRFLQRLNNADEKVLKAVLNNLSPNARTGFGQALENYPRYSILKNLYQTIVNGGKLSYNADEDNKKIQDLLMQVYYS